MEALGLFFILAIVFGGLLAITAGLVVLPATFIFLESGALSGAVVLTAYLVILPLSALFAVLILERWILEQGKGGALSVLAVVIAVYLMLENPNRFIYFEQLQLLFANETLLTGAILLALCQKGLVCAVVAALLVGLVVVAAELPFKWFLAHSQAAISLEGVRVLLLFFILVSSLHLLIGFFASMMAPTVVFQGLMP